jgi:hypothetical protein
MRSGAVLTIALLVCACSDKAARKTAAPKPCEHFGQTCEFAPKKLGTCVEKPNCTGPGCLVCQSQH